jgi:hypothetical protein
MTNPVERELKLRSVCFCYEHFHSVRLWGLFGS